MNVPKRITQVPKVCGVDIELANFIYGSEDERTGAAASRALLREIRGYPYRTTTYGTYTAGGWSSWGQSANAPNPQDWGRKYLATSGSCAYVDLDHLEICTCETVAARDHVAAWHAMVRVARQAMRDANERMPEGHRVQAIANNSDSRGSSFGSHINMLLTRQAWENLFADKLHYLLVLASYQISSIVFTGQGKVGAENGHPHVPFQLSQRADFFETMIGGQTTFRRPIVNARDESLTGNWDAQRTGVAREDLARLHSIFFDSTLQHGATFLKVGVLQIIVAMIEAECVPSSLILENALDAVVGYSHDPSLEARARIVTGEDLSAVELQMRFHAAAERFVADGGCDGIVPDAQEILELWGDTLAKLAARDFGALAGRLDWVLKLSILGRSLERKGLDFSAPQARFLDVLYGSICDRDGLFWAYERAGATEQVVSEEDIVRAGEEPPEDTRAWTRAMLLRAAGPERVIDVNWDYVKVATDPRRRWATTRIDLPDPLSATKADNGHHFEMAESFEELVDALQPDPPDLSDSAVGDSDEEPETNGRRLVVVVPKTVH